MTRLVLVEDEQLVREGLRRLLEFGSDFEVVAEASDGEEALRLIPTTAPDVVLLDVRMPRLGGLEVLARLRAAGCQPPSLVLTTFDEPDLLLQAVRLGARGFLPKDVSLEELINAIRALAAGGTWFQPSLTSSLRRSVEALPLRPHTCEIWDRLTPREKQVLRLAAGGLSNREIASTLRTSEGTVKNQMASVLSKIGVHDRTLAVLKAIEAGVL
jgi:DNA-binding NarL/FixJ family response regulator